MKVNKIFETLEKVAVEKGKILIIEKLIDSVKDTQSKVIELSTLETILIMQKMKLSDKLNSILSNLDDEIDSKETHDCSKCDDTECLDHPSKQN